MTIQRISRVVITEELECDGQVAQSHRMIGHEMWRMGRSPSAPRTQIRQPRDEGMADTGN